LEITIAPLFKELNNEGFILGKLGFLSLHQDSFMQFLFFVCISAWFMVMKRVMIMKLHAKKRKRWEDGWILELLLINYGDVVEFCGRGGV
jgi:hypothetical protein